MGVIALDCIEISLKKFCPEYSIKSIFIPRQNSNRLYYTANGFLSIQDQRKIMSKDIAGYSKVGRVQEIKAIMPFTSEMFYSFRDGLYVDNETLCSKLCRVEFIPFLLHVGVYVCVCVCDFFQILPHRWPYSRMLALRKTKNAIYESENHAWIAILRSWIKKIIS